ncbi:MAG: TFIIB-type zinc ribbon-containing protein [Clostridia bacterium]|nr:TFIIB-type zinc ribbon-containing protein [Clostridia bacterium]MBR6110175.1 TFIIB-type zinc ribbon-containing protein [Clostridia bacterium]
MSILAAKCPCCGRDIGIEENTEEYTCVFCGTKLKVAALKTTPVEEADKQSGAAEVKDAPVNGEHKSSAGGENGRHGRHHSRHESVSSKEINAPELTREEIEEELKRKAEFKEELHSALHQINELRARRPKLEARLRTVTTLGIVGAILAVVAGGGMFFFADGESDMLLIVSGVLAVLALAMLITSGIRRKDVKKQQSRLEESILEKKQKRDILIGRLNKINKTLHIHSDD